MIFFKFLRVALICFGVQISNFVCAQEISYTNNQDSCSRWSLVERYNESLKNFFNRDDIIFEITEKKEEYEKLYSSIEEMKKSPYGEYFLNWRDYRVSVLCSFALTGGILFPLFMYSFSNISLDILNAFGMGLGSSTFALFDSFIELYFEQKGIYVNKTNELLLEESLEGALRRKVGEDINQKLYDAGYLTKNGLYPISESETITDDFLDRVLKSELHEVVVSKHS